MINKNNETLTRGIKYCRTVGYSRVVACSAGLACSVFGLILGPPTLGATFYISIAGLANSLHSVSTDCFD